MSLPLANGGLRYHSQMLITFFSKKIACREKYSIFLYTKNAGLAMRPTLIDSIFAANHFEIFASCCSITVQNWAGRRLRQT